MQAGSIAHSVVSWRTAVRIGSVLFLLATLLTVVRVPDAQGATGAWEGRARITGMEVDEEPPTTFEWKWNYEFDDSSGEPAPIVFGASYEFLTDDICKTEALGVVEYPPGHLGTGTFTIMQLDETTVRVDLIPLDAPIEITVVRSGPGTCDNDTYTYMTVPPSAAAGAIVTLIDPNQEAISGTAVSIKEQIVSYWLHRDCTGYDSDGDGLSDCEEVSTYNTDPSDPDSDDDGLNDGDEVGLGTDPGDADTDDDGSIDPDDAFPIDPAESVDTDGDGEGNNKDQDDDNDGTPDESDQFPQDPTESVDTDGDGIGNNADTDDDGDGFSDVDEIAAGSDPLDPNSTPGGGGVEPPVAPEIECSLRLAGAGTLDCSAQRDRWGVLTSMTLTDTNAADGDCVYVEVKVQVTGGVQSPDADVRYPDVCDGGTTTIDPRVQPQIVFGQSLGHAITHVEFKLCEGRFLKDPCRQTGRMVLPQYPPGATPEELARVAELMLMPLDEFLAIKAIGPSPYNWSDDGCSMKQIPHLPGPADFFNALFRTACLRHDFGYRQYGGSDVTNGRWMLATDAMRRFVDDNFYVDMIATCNSPVGIVVPQCEEAAAAYQAGVKLFAGSSFYGLE
jgi:Prokaryotic phospholipase A2/Bacterial TSP3 repeat